MTTNSNDPIANNNQTTQLNNEPLNANLPWQNRSSNQIEPNGITPPINNTVGPNSDLLTEPPMNVVQEIPEVKSIVNEQPIIQNPVIDNVVEQAPIAPTIEATVAQPVIKSEEPIIKLGPELPKVGTPINGMPLAEEPIMQNPVIQEPSLTSTIQPTIQPDTTIKMPEQVSTHEDSEIENKRRVKNIIFTIVVLIAGVAALLFGIIVASNAA